MKPELKPELKNILSLVSKIIPKGVFEFSQAAQTRGASGTSAGQAANKNVEPKQ
jgi:hypothetical protein